MPSPRLELLQRRQWVLQSLTEIWKLFLENFSHHAEFVAADKQLCKMSLGELDENNSF